MMKLEIGTILCSTWGYEAKIANFYKVVKLTSKMVTLQELPKIETGNWIEGESMPDLAAEPYRNLIVKKISAGGINMGTQGWATHWNGKAISTYNHH